MIDLFTTQLTIYNSDSQLHVVIYTKLLVLITYLIKAIPKEHPQPHPMLPPMGVGVKTQGVCHELDYLRGQFIYAETCLA